MAEEHGLERKDAVQLLHELGFLGANKWDTPKLLEKLKEVPVLSEGVSLEDESARTCNAVKDALNSNMKIVILGEDEEEVKEEPSKEKKMSIKIGKKPTVKSVPKEKTVPVKESKTKTKTKTQIQTKTNKPEKKEKTKPEKREKIPVDKFGTRVGTDGSKVNKVLSAKFKDMKTLMQEAGIYNAVYGHLDKLIAKGIVEKQDKKYRLVPKTK